MSRYVIYDKDGYTLKHLDAHNRTQAFEQAEKCREFYPHIEFQLWSGPFKIRTYQPN